MTKRLFLAAIVALMTLMSAYAQREHYTSDTSLAEQLKLIKESKTASTSISIPTSVQT